MSKLNLPLFIFGEWSPSLAVQTGMVSRPSQPTHGTARPTETPGFWKRLVGGRTEKTAHVPSSLAPQAASPPSLQLSQALQTFTDSGSMELCIFGFEVQSLPESISDVQSISDANKLERLAGELTRWSTQLSELRAMSRAGFSVRLLANNGSVSIAVLGRAAMPRGQSAAAAATMVEKLQRFFETRSIKASAIVDRARLEEFRLIRGDIWEIRQRETLLTLQVSGSPCDTYCVHPLGEASGTWLDLFSQLAGASSTVLVNLHIEPTEERYGERDFWTQCADIAKKLEDVSLQGQRIQIQDRSTSAPLVYGSYNTMTSRLSDAFLGVAQVTSADPNISPAIAHTLASAMTATTNVNPDPGFGRQLEPRVDVHAASGKSLPAARATFETMMLTDWLSTPEPNFTHLLQQRLRFLFDAKAVGSLFRLPISVGRGIPGVKTHRPKTGYDDGPRVSVLPSGHLLLGRTHSGSIVSVDHRQLTKHTLICGQPGSGKTNTSLSLLAQLWREHHVPFWVIEPPKREYRGLLKQRGFEDALLFTVGDESVSPLRLNPFELLPGVTVAEHVQRLKVCFEAGLPGLDGDSGALIMLVNQALDDIYGSFDWRSGDRFEDGDSRSFPTMVDFLARARRTVDGYAAEVKANLGRALENRIGSFLKGPKGTMFNCQRGLPLNQLMNRPVIFEMASMGEEASLVIMFLLMTLREQGLQRQGDGLHHAVMVEEAHAVMRKPTQSHGASAGAAKAFGDILSEMRGAGEAVLLADQLPGRLIDDAIGNTELKIVHRLTKRDEVEAVAMAMAAEDEHLDQIVRLNTGEAAIFMGGMQGLSFISAPPFKLDNHYDERVSNSEVKRAMTAFYQSLPSDSVLPFHGCQLCKAQCKYRSAVERIARDPEWREKFRDATDAHARTPAVNDKDPDSREKKTKAKAIVYQVTIDAAKTVSRREEIVDAAWCFLSQRLEENVIVSRSMRREFDDYVAAAMQQ